MDHLELLNRNRDLFKKIKSLASDQEQFIQDDRLDDFMILLRKRKRVKDEISSNFRKYERLLKKNRKKETKSSESCLSIEISDVIRSIQDTDKRIEELLEQNKDRLFDEIKAFKKGKDALKGYGGKSKNNPKFIDRRG